MVWHTPNQCFRLGKEVAIKLVVYSHDAKKVETAQLKKDFEKYRNNRNQEMGSIFDVSFALGQLYSPPPCTRRFSTDSEQKSGHKRDLF